MAFKIAEGFVGVKAEVDRESVKRSAREVATMAADEMDNEGRRRSGGFWKTLLTPTFSIPFLPNFLSSPLLIIAAAIAALFASTFIAAVATFVLAGGFGAVLL